MFGHVSSLNIYDPTDAPGGAGIEATKRILLERMALLEPFRRRLVEVPFGLDNPYWIEDPAFDIDFHVRHHAVPPPGSPEQLAEVVSRIVARPLDRDRPLWELYVIEGVDDGRLIAQLTKVHHATIDGASGAAMLAALLDEDPDYRPPALTHGAVGARADAVRRRAAAAHRRRDGPPPGEAGSPHGAGSARACRVVALGRPARPGRHAGPADARADRPGDAPPAACPDAATTPTDHRHCPPPRRRAPRGTRRSRRTAASPTRRCRWTTPRRSAARSVARSTMSSWRCARARCAATCWPTTRCRPSR